MGSPLHMTGQFMGRAGKALVFLADFEPMPNEIEFLPASQCWFTPDPLADTPNHGTMVIAGWLAKKNGWDIAPI